MKNPTYNEKKANWIGNAFTLELPSKHFIKRKIERRIEVMGQRGRSQQLLDDFKEMTGYYKMKEETLDHTLC